VETAGDRVRVELGAPLPLTAEVTHAALVALRLEVGEAVWASVKATELAVQAA
jgi:molybdate transport system ATP-binding protein